MATIAFDVYGTLIDTDGVVSRLREWIGSQADVFSQTWRSKQLEYSFRRGFMRRYENFAVCTRHPPPTQPVLRSAKREEWRAGDGVEDAAHVPVVAEGRFLRECLADFGPEQADGDAAGLGYGCLSSVNVATTARWSEG